MPNFLYRESWDEEEDQSKKFLENDAETARHRLTNFRRRKEELQRRLDREFNSYHYYGGAA